MVLIVQMVRCLFTCLSVCVTVISNVSVLSTDGLGSGQTVAIIVMCVVVLPAILLAFIFCLYKKHRSRKGKI